MNKYIFIIPTGLALSFSGVYADNCPPPPSSVSPSVRVKVSYSAKTKLYTYRYTLSNAPSSQLPIYYFSLLLPQSPSNILAPSNWLGEFFGSSAGNPPNLRWTTIALNQASVTDEGGGKLPAPSYAIKPGSQLEGFSFASAQPPGIGEYFAEGFTQDPSATPTGINDEPIPNCPGWDFTNSRFLSMITGLTTAPSNPNLTSVKIRLRNESGGSHCGPIESRHPSGKIGVIILSSKSFDASQVDPASVKFGPGFASATASKLVPSAFGIFDEEDEREEWEKVDGFLNVDNKNAERKNLLLTFNIKDLQIRCGLDQALFLSGKTKDGKNFAGGVSSQLKFSGCDAGHDEKRIDR